MKRLLAALLVVLGTSLTMVAVPGTANAVPNVCPAGDSGKIDLTGDDEEITLTAPEGFLIDSVCIKGGQVVEILTFDPPQAEVTVSLQSGKGISHYSVTYVPCDTYNCEPPPPSS